MNSLKRVMNAVSGNPYDRTPVFPSMINAATHIQKRNQRDYSTNGGYLAETLIKNRQIFDYDGIYVSSDNWIMYSALGGTVDFPDDDEPMGREVLCRDIHDYRRLKVPDPTKDGRMPVIIEAVKITMDQAGQDYFILANIDSGPFQLAGILRGLEQFFFDLNDSSQHIQKMIQFCQQVTITYGVAVREATGVPAVQFGDSTASLLSREQYEEFVFPHECQVIEELQKAGLLVFLHICGNSTHILDLMVQTGADCLEIDEAVDLGRAFEIVNNRTCIRGNIRTTLFLDGTREQVFREAQRCVRLSKGGKYILCAGCGIPKYSKFENLKALREAVET
jgi:uroporphyrinogen decarboxylase